MTVMLAGPFCCWKSFKNAQSLLDANRLVTPLPFAKLSTEPAIAQRVAPGPKMRAGFTAISQR